MKVPTNAQLATLNEYTTTYHNDPLATTAVLSINETNKSWITISYVYVLLCAWSRYVHVSIKFSVCIDVCVRMFVHVDILISLSCYE